MMVRQGGRTGTQAHEDVWSPFDDVLGRQAMRETEAAVLPSETQQDLASGLACETATLLQCGESSIVHF